MPNESSKLLKERLDTFTNNDPDFWSFKGKSRRENSHGYFQYPAMMVPQMQGRLLDTILETSGKIQHVLDPFVGSGTVLTETMLRGLNFTGFDINPLAVLLCKTKSGPYDVNGIESSIQELNFRIRQDNKTDTDIVFKNIEKWFPQQVIVELARLRRNIKEEPAAWKRRFFWVALAETVRLCSNSRTTTFKLHMRSKEDIDSRTDSALTTFSFALNKNLSFYRSQHQILAERGLLNSNYEYTGDIEIRFADTASLDVAETLCHKFDLLISSPPYGDNTTTVTYGQHAFLPLNWIDFDDIDSAIPIDLISNTHRIDSVSLGGTKSGAAKSIELLSKKSPVFATFISTLSGSPPDRANRVAAFCRDLDASFSSIAPTLRTGAVLVWTVGNRCVGGRTVPTDDIMIDLLRHHEINLTGKYSRSIPTKRMAIKNSIAGTMQTESILVMRKNNHG